MEASIAVPGERLGSAEQYSAGNGTYSRHGHIYSCLAGYRHVEKDGDKSVMSIVREEEKDVVPKIGSIVTCKVTSVNPRFCKAAILGVESTALKETFRGMIRKEDVRATEKDRVEIYKCFRPGDIVVARVTSLGDAHSYLLSTAENELGVVFAKSEAGATMVPISWCEMQCPKTMAKEQRKVAKVLKQS
ncbi:predicted protein [Nematostella vectensis]|uniref:Exosome complex component CSL4 n=1 Tax=Nematostella vectensis TaxID=45351 RepID=A7RH11_NEMVE|nr:exosome complex component CSL4 isoform X2 [Nematostella vectensis]EDO49274.1 predicted protein [Nematostella vectensis]|eukprot:XP_001641337.1 predicted protein [Nematostella vectensis]